MVTVLNKATGELIELSYASFEDFAFQYNDLTQQIAALERAKKKMSSELKLMMGDEDRLPLTNGWHFKKTSVVRKNYDRETLLKYFDYHELFSTMATIANEKSGEVKEAYILTPNKTAIDALLKEHSEDGGRWDAASTDLSRSMIVESATESLRLYKEN